VCASADVKCAQTSEWHLAREALAAAQAAHNADAARVSTLATELAHAHQTLEKYVGMEGATRVLAILT
jgi:hypothetical protein